MWSDRMNIVRMLAAASAAFFFALTPVAAQNPGAVTNHAFVIGKGPGQTGFTSLLCGSAQLAVGQSAADPICRTVTGDVTIDAAGVTAIGTNKVANGMLRQSGALSLIGRSANSTGNVADIQAAAGSSCAFRESGSTLACGTLATAAYAANSVTNAKLAQMANATIKGRTTAGAGDPEDLTAAQTRSLLSLVVGTNVQAWDADLDCIAAISTNGLVTRTGAGTCAVRTVTAPAAGITVTNGDGASGNPTLALANDLAALEGLSGTGIARRTGTDAWSVGSTVAVSEGGTGGVSASGTLLDNIAGFSGTGFLTRTGAGTYAFQSATNGITNSNLAQAGAVTLKGNPTGSTANVQDFTIQGLTARGAPDATNDRLLIWDAAAGTLKYVSPGEVASSATAGVSSLNGLTGGLTYLAGMHNRIINPNGRIWQRQNTGTSAVTDGAYAWDRWYGLVQTAGITASRVTNAENGTPNMMRFTQSQASAQRFGLAQYIESQNAIDLRGQSVTLSARVRMSASTTLRYAIIEWTGTVDSVTRDVVNDWTSGTFTPGNFFIASNVTITATGSTALSANTLTSVSLSGTLGSSANNLAVFLWTDSTQAQNVTLDVGKVQLEQGSQATPLAVRPIAEEIGLCQRTYQKSYELETAPGTAGGSGNLPGNVRIRASGTVAQFTAFFRTEMLKVPNVTVYSSGTGASGNIYNTSAATDLAATAIDPGTSAFTFQGTSATDQQGYIGQYVADAEL